MRYTVDATMRRRLGRVPAPNIRILNCVALATALTAMSCDGGAPPQYANDDGGAITVANPDGSAGTSAGGTGGSTGSIGGGGNPGAAAGGGGAADSGAGPDSGQGQDGGGSSGGSDDAAGAMQPSSGCGMEPVAAGSATLQVNGMERQYLVALPQTYDRNRPYPLVLAFHGAGLTGPQFRSFFNLVTPVGTDGIVVYPTGLGGGWDVRRDVPFVDALLMKLESSYCIDAQRIFATGHSNGGFFTNALGCQRGDALRAIAPMSGGQQQRASSCTGNVAVWISHGNADDIVMTSYGRQSRDFWVARNECDAMMVMPVSSSPCVEYLGCAAGAPVRYCEYDGGHNLMPMSAQTIWAFFKQF
jgi:poly(3-hydroxybutyrate) depolymerase